MNNLVILKAENFEDDKQEIESQIKSDPWFVLDNRDLTLDEYLTNLHEQYELKNKDLTRLKICRNITWGQDNITVIDVYDVEKRPTDMIDLLKEFPDGTRGADIPEDKPLASIIIENNERKLLANIAQQFIYLAYPLAEIDIRRRKEFRDAESVRRLMQNIDSLAQTADEAINNISMIAIPSDRENSKEMEECKQKALDSYMNIQEKISRAREIEMKVAVAASKKTGKSVIVNCMLGQELAPTSLEMATPNSCVYRKSPDDNYHLVWDKASPLYKANSEKFRDGTYRTSEELYKAINAEFKAAQKDKDNKFLIPDMTIEYVSNGNNFESYTIHDTPGPDAAGTDHKESAKKAMKECDASIFAIDYGKYLTEDEKKYLDDVKSIFAEKNKFHTLLFDINKLDMALQDSSAQSRVKSIDFIRNRLIDIDSQYEDCIIFASSALDYFNTITLEKSAKNFPQLLPLLEPETNWNKKLDDIMDELEENDINLGESTITAMSNLNSETGKLKRMLGYKHVNLHEFREFSGIPQLMGYLNYILQSKAREEIVNYIAVTIDALTGNINDIINKGSNLLDSLHWTEDKILRIKAILEEYSQKVHTFLDKYIMDDDMEVVRNGKYFSAIADKLLMEQRQISFDEILAKANDSLKNLIKEKDIIKELWNQYFTEHVTHLKRLKYCGAISPERLHFSSSEFRTMVEKLIKNKRDNLIADEENNLNDLADDLKALLEKRFQKIREAGSECRKKLDKESCNLKLPELPTFSVDFPEPVIRQLSINGVQKLNKNLSGEFNPIDKWDQLAENWKRHGLKVWNYEDFTGMINLSNYSDKEFEDFVENRHSDFYKICEENNIMAPFEELVKDIGKNSIASQEELLRNFYSLVGICQTAVDEFSQLIDERGYYEHKSLELKEFLEFIEHVKQSSNSFMKIWQSIKAPENEKTEVVA